MLTHSGGYRDDKRRKAKHKNTKANKDSLFQNHITIKEGGLWHDTMIKTENKCLFEIVAL